MNKREAELLRKIAECQQLAILYVRNGCERPECAWLGNYRTTEAAAVADQLAELLTGLVKEQQERINRCDTLP